MKILRWLFFCFLSNIAVGTQLNSIVVFGDSMSDNGNLYEYLKHQLPSSPPYYDGRFSDGPVWIENIAKMYYPTQTTAHLLDYAFGGAGIAEDDDVLFTLNREMQSYLLAHQQQADKNSLYVVWIGANNYLGIPKPEEIDSLTTTVIDGIQSGLKKLVAAGAQHIMVMNLPNLGETPAAELFAAADILQQCTELHNAKLFDTFAELKQEFPQVDWLLYDVSAVFNQVRQDPSRYGFTNIKDTCYDIALMHNEASTILSNPMLMIATQILLSVTPHVCDSYFYFDPVHPTALTHRILAHYVDEFLKNSNIEFVV